MTGTEASEEAQPPSSPPDSKLYSLESVIRSCVDLGQLCRPEPTIAYRQFSSRDRSQDLGRAFGNYFRSTPEEGDVWTEVKGPGCLLRLFCANPSGRLEIFLDGSPVPALDEEMEHVFTGDCFPFLAPLVENESGSTSWLPLPFFESCKIACRGSDPLFYQAEVKLYPAETPLETWSLDRFEGLRPAFDHVLGLLSDPGSHQVQALHGADLLSIPLKGEVDPDDSIELLRRQGPGSLVLLELEGDSAERHFAQKVLLEIYWEDSDHPAVLCPLSEFFGASFGGSSYKALPMGGTGRGGYSLFPMPFLESARIILRNQGAERVKIEGRVLLKNDSPGENPLRFHAGWKRSNPCTDGEHTVLHTWGRGKFVGCALFLHNPRNRWWDEGGEMIQVDGEEQSTFLGTSAAHYFGGGWTLAPRAGPYAGCSLLQSPKHDNKTCVYRFHITDSIPFTHSFRISFPHLSKDLDCSSVAWWYEDDAEGAGFFQMGKAKDRIPAKPRAMDALEAESLEVLCAEGKSLIVDDAGLPRELSQGKGLLLRGRGPFALVLGAADPGSYRLLLGPAHDLPYPELRVSPAPGARFSAHPVPAGMGIFLGTIEAAELYHPGGRLSIRLDALGPWTDEDRFILDFMKVEPVPLGPSPESGKR